MSEFRLNRVFSQPLTEILLRTPMTPNHITFLSLLLGLCAGCFFAQGGILFSFIGAAFYQAAVVLDNCDGEVARAKNLKSAFGAWLDIAADFLTDFALFLGITAGVLRGGNPGAPFWFFAFLCLSGTFLHLTLVVLEKLRGFGPAEFSVPHPEHETRKNPFLTFFDALREGDASWFVLFLAVLGKIDWLVWVGGVYMQVLWITALAVNFRWLFRKAAA